MGYSLTKGLVACVLLTGVLSGVARAQSKEGTLSGVRVWVLPKCPVVDSTLFKVTIEESGIAALGISFISQFAGAAVKAIGASISNAGAAQDLKISAATPFSYYVLPPQVPPNLATKVGFKYAAEPGCIVFAKGTFGPTTPGNVKLDGLPNEILGGLNSNILRPLPDRMSGLAILGISGAPDLYAEFVVRPRVEGRIDDTHSVVSVTDFEIRPVLFWNRKPLSPGFGRSDGVSSFDFVFAAKQPTGAALPEAAVHATARLTLGNLKAGAAIGPQAFGDLAFSVPFPVSSYTDDKLDALRKVGWPNGDKSPAPTPGSKEADAREAFGKAYEKAAAKEYTRHFLTVTYTASFGENKAMKAAGEATTGMATSIADEVKKALTPTADPTLTQFGEYYAALADAAAKFEMYEAARQDSKITPVDQAAKYKDAVTAAALANTRAATVGKALPYPEFAK